MLLAQAETRWDRFAKEKGITGSKRSRNVWDDDMKEWRPRHGFKRANDGVLNHAIVEVKAVSRGGKGVRIARTAVGRPVCWSVGRCKRLSVLRGE